MKCPDKLFEDAPEKCTHCKHRKSDHGNEADHACECGCGYFEISESVRDMLLEAPSASCYAKSYHWHPLNPALVGLSIPRCVERFVSYAGFEKYLESYRAYKIFPKLHKQASKYREIGVGDLVLGVVQSHPPSLAIGLVKPDPVFPTLPSTMIHPSGLHYEIDGMMVTNGVKQLTGVWAWPSIICQSVIKLNRAQEMIEGAFGDLPYKVAKEILG